jgi:predicted PurR-regulated permease PerM
MALAYVLDPLANRLARRGISRMVAASIILGGLVLAFALLLLLIAPVLAKQLSGFIDNAPGYAQRLQSLVSDPNHPWLKRIVGFVGLLLAVPLAAATGVLIRFAVRRYRDSPLYTGIRPA